jgi:hypothetical protein
MPVLTVILFNNTLPTVTWLSNIKRFRSKALRCGLLLKTPRFVPSLRAGFHAPGNRGGDR